MKHTLINILYMLFTQSCILIAFPAFTGKKSSIGFFNSCESKLLCKGKRFSCSFLSLSSKIAVLASHAFIVSVSSNAMAKGRKRVSNWIGCRSRNDSNPCDSKSFSPIRIRLSSTIERNASLALYGIRQFSAIAFSVGMVIDTVSLLTCILVVTLQIS